MSSNDSRSDAEFYDDRYSGDYLDDWPAEKKARIRELVRSVVMPPHGRVLDYGCGVGVFTGVLKEALPGWVTVGADISAKAIEKAQARFPECLFQTIGPDGYLEGRYDVLFSHHVLEHVFDIESAASTMAALCAPSGFMIHVLPCGNPGSFEHAVCSMSLGGIEKKRGNRFFFEDMSHVRRLTTLDMVKLLEPHGFVLVHSFYANQFWGGVDWITTYDSSFIKMLFSTDKAINLKALIALSGMGVCGSLLQRVRNYHTTVKYGQSRFTDVLKHISVWLGRTLVALAQREWRDQKLRENGSEMYLVFERRS